MNTEDRLAQVERQLRWLKRLGALAIAGVRPRDDLTPYARLGDTFALGCLAVAVAAAVRGLRA